MFSSRQNSAHMPSLPGFPKNWISRSGFYKDAIPTGIPEKVDSGSRFYKDAIPIGIPEKLAAGRQIDTQVIEGQQESEAPSFGNFAPILGRFALLGVAVSEKKPVLLSPRAGQLASQSRRDGIVIETKPPFCCSKIPLGMAYVAADISRRNYG